MTFAELGDKVKNIKLDELVTKAVDLNKTAIADLNKSQMLVGLRADGTEIVPSYRNRNYADAKKAAGSRAPFGTPDLKLTGSFQAAMLVVAGSKSYNIFSRDPKYKPLTEKYENIWGLTEENQIEARRLTSKSLGELFKQATGIKG